MVKLSELTLKTVKPDGDDTVDCLECKYPINTKFEQTYISKTDETYIICPECGEIYKVKE